MNLKINNVALQMGTIYLIGSTILVTVVGAWEVEAVYANSMRTNVYIVKNSTNFAMLWATCLILVSFCR